jgi:uncharacterized membrane protein YfhO
LVLADTWYPGWQASIDGSGVKIFRANYLFRAVAIPPGTHSIHFVYDPLSFFLGSVLSVIGLIGVTLLGIVCFRRK